jgi:hypothetical protein
VVEKLNRKERKDLRKGRKGNYKTLCCFVIQLNRKERKGLRKGRKGNYKTL